MLDLPRLDFSLNSRQFNITLDVVRNVMLAPPLQVAEEESEAKPQEDKEAPSVQESKREGEGSWAEGVDLNNKTHKEELRQLIEVALLKVRHNTICIICTQIEKPFCTDVQTPKSSR
jgi:hypothetical protein